MFDCFVRLNREGILDGAFRKLGEGVLVLRKGGFVEGNVEGCGLNSFEGEGEGGKDEGG